MKKILVILAIIISCNKKNNTEQKLQYKIENIIKNNLDNPNSFEFVSMNFIDTIYLIDNYKNNKTNLFGFAKTYESSIKQSKHFLNEWKKRLKTIPQKKSYIQQKISENTDAIRTNSKKLKEIKKSITEIDSIIIDLEKKIKKPFEINVKYKFRTTNEYNAKVLKTYNIYVNDSLEILDLNEVLK